MTLRGFKVWTLTLCSACLLLAGWMLYNSLSGGSLAGCGAGSICDSVLESPWAYVLWGVPVTLPAAVVYLLLVLCLLFLSGKRAESCSLDRLIWPLMLFLSGCILGAVVWFGWLQVGVLHALCKYCIALHLLGCIAAVLIIKNGKDYCPHPLMPFGFGVAAAAIFTMVQVNTLPEAVQDSGPVEVSLPAFEEGEVPVIQGEGEESLTLLFDFQCSHCRRLHRMLPSLTGQYRIFLVPVPLSSACNPYIPSSGIDRFAGSCQLTRLAMAVWYTLPGEAMPYWDYLLDKGATPADAETRALALLGDGYESAIADPRIDAYLKKAEELFGRTSSRGGNRVPRFISGERWLVPRANNADELLELIRTELQ